MPHEQGIVVVELPAMVTEKEAREVILGKAPEGVSEPLNFFSGFGDGYGPRINILFVEHGEEDAWVGFFRKRKIPAHRLWKRPHHEFDRKTHSRMHR